MGYIIPAPPFVDPKKAATAKATSATLTAAECNGYIITNAGSSGTVVLTLPAAATVAGCTFKIQVTVAQIVRCTPASGEKVYLGGDGVASKYLNIAAAIGNYADVYSDGVDYMVVGYSGVVTKEA